LTWSPQYCRGRDGAGDRFQCGGNARFGLMLHGLWPDGAGRQWPQYCAPTGIVPRKLVGEMLCTTPSADLIQHEWAKHGTCGWKEPSAYFAQARRLYQALRMPDMVALSRRPALTVGALRDAFVAANRHVPGLTAASVRVRMTREGWFDELWLCLDRDFRYAPCRAGQQGGREASRRIAIWRGALNGR
ncbi:MAG: ribonuclease T, partial [Sphingobium sp.]